MKEREYDNRRGVERDEIYDEELTDIYALCHICKNQAKHMCRICQRPVCNEHYDIRSEACDTCRKGKRIR